MYITKKCEKKCDFPFFIIIKKIKLICNVCTNKYAIIIGFLQMYDIINTF